AKDTQLAVDLKDKDLKIAEANKRAAEATLALEKFKAPRTLSSAQQAQIGEKLKRFAGVSYDGAIGPKGDPEPLYVFRFLHSALSSAGWNQVDWTGGGETYTEPGISAIGLTMVTNIIVDVHPDYWNKLGPAATALAASLNAEGIDAIADSRPTTIKSD